jgi:D-beta-D-heptose 7-phosphate kinase/D-beta-D-heptose 1-phosphate adenosyltransferase
VVAILAALECDVTLAGAVGDDSQAETVGKVLEGLRVPADGLRRDSRRITTVKERLLGRTQSRHPQQMIRIDRESIEPIADDLADEMLVWVSGRLVSTDVVLVSDYAKGVCTPRLVRGLLSAARAAGVPVIIDPARGADWSLYTGCTCITPNRTESGMALGVEVRTREDGVRAARRLLQFGIESVIVKLDRDGMVWAHADGRSGEFPVHARQVYDITGAGDAVLSALGLAVALGADWPAAIDLANAAGRLEVQRLGVAPFTRTELLDEYAREGFSTGHKIVALDRLLRQLAERRAAGERIAMTNGCFDLIHPGHVASLQFARSQGDCLVVGLNSDRSAEQLKGPGHPVVNEQGRAEVLAALACVDYVVIFDDRSVAGLVEQVRPDVLVKADQYALNEVVGHDVVAAYGGRVVLAPMRNGYSTSRLVASIRGEKSR